MIKPFVDGEIEKIFWELDNETLGFEPLSPFFTRPAYAYTKAAVGGINHEKIF